MSDSVSEDPKAEPRDMKARAVHEAKELVRFVAGAFAVYLVIITLAFRTFYIPSGSMEPTLQVGDRVIVLNFLYGYSRHSLPFGIGDLLPAGDGRILGGLPGRGDVVVFRNPNRGEKGHLIKRVVGLPGDTVQVQRGRLIINGELVPQEPLGVTTYKNHYNSIVSPDEYVETLPNGREHSVFDLGSRYDLDDTPPITVPADHVFVMGDNRDASSDSRNLRDLGPVPTEYLVGRAVTVLFTLHGCKKEPGLECPSGRVWRGL